jgi:hypothetical protein
MVFSDIVHIPADTASIQGGIEMANEGDTVLVAEDTYYENINFKGKAITVASMFIMDQDTNHISNTIIDGSKTSHPDSGSVVYFISGEDTTSVLCGFSITGGTGTYSPANPPVQPMPFRTGGGIYCSMSGAYIKNNIISGNECVINITDGHAGGGGICADPPGYNSFVLLEKNKIMNNLAWSQSTTTGWGFGWAQGGGIAIFSNGLIIQNQIISNQCKTEHGYGCGGGIRIMGGTVNIINNDIRQNSSVSILSQGFAGGISCSGANSVIDGNTISNNFIAGASDCHGAAIYFDLDNNAYRAVVKNNYIYGNYFTDGTCYGGAIGIFRSNPDVFNNILMKNSASYGGALHIFNNSKPRIVNNTITANNASQAGGAIYAENSDTDVVLMNSILWNNHATVTNNEIDNDNGANISGVYCDIAGGWEGEGNIDIDPVFKFPAHDEYDLDKYSPCIGTGVASHTLGEVTYEAPETDFYGRIRPAEDVDMGALESGFAGDMNDLVLYLNFDDSTANDASGYENHGSPVGQPRDTSGILGNAFYFDGESKIRIPDSESLDTDTSMTISAWIRPDSVSTGGAKFMCKWYSAPQQGDWLFSLSSRDSVYNGDTFVQWAGYAANYGQFGGYIGIGIPRDSMHAYLKLHQWQHIAITFDRGYMCSYVNGQFVDDTMSVVEYTSLNEYNTDDIFIGGFRIYREGYQFFGSLDEVRIYDRALSAEEVQSLFELVTKVEKKSAEDNVSLEYTLYQNFPNPFNPVTRIAFSLPAAESVKLKVYNILGQTVVLLLDDNLQAGRHEVEFHAGYIPSGVYFYKLQAGKYVDTRKMLLIK